MSEILKMYASESDASLHTNPYVLPSPAYEGGLNQTHSTLVTSGRNSQGTVIGQRTMDRDLVKLTLKWSVLLNSDWQGMLSEIASAVGRTDGTGEGFYVWIRYYDAQANKFLTREFYPSDRTATVFMVDKTTGKPTLWKDCSINFIDTGNSKEYED